MTREYLLRRLKGGYWLAGLLGLLAGCSGNVRGEPMGAPDSGDSLESTSAQHVHADDETAGEEQSSRAPAPSSPSGDTRSPSASADPNPPEVPSVNSGAALRLTRAELDHALRDLLGDNSGAAAELLAEEEFSPFDNDARRQIVSPALLESVHTLARNVAERAANDASTRGAWMPCEPSSSADEACFDMTLTKLARLFFRRDVQLTELAEYRRLMDFAVEANDFYFAVELLLSALIQDPEFLYRLERPVAGVLSGAEIATRLSFALWGTVPDATLLDQASVGALASGEGRDLVARRMLESPLTKQQFFRFHAMWLGYRAIPHEADLTAAFQQETEALLERVLFETPKSYLALFESRETFVTDALANHYGLPAPGGAVGWVTYPESSGRAGILSHGSVLSAFSKFDDTSPTQRGIFIRTRLLCQTVPHPPPAVNVDQPPGGEDAESTCKLDRYRAHREQSGCNECHLLFDPIGEGLERFDRAGRFREHDDGNANCIVDGQGELPGVGAFNGPAELSSLLVEQGALQSCFTKQLLSYARGTSALSGADQTFAADMTAAFEAEGLIVKNWLPLWVADERFVQPLEASR